MLTTQVTLQDNKKYAYTVNSIGMAMTKTILCVPYLLNTSDVESVIATVVDKSTIFVQCIFIYGSNVLGCRVEL